MLTAKEDLRTGTPVWKTYGVPRIPTSPLTKNETADVIVIGAGISGAMIALELAEAGLSVIILDRRGAIKGSSMATTALLQYEIDTPLIKLTEQIGFEKAMRAWRRSKLGLESLAAKIQMLNIPCDFERRNSLYLSGDALNAKELQQEHDIRQQIGLPCAYLNQHALKQQFGISRKAALLSFDNLSVNPVHLTAGILRYALNLGAKIYAPVDVTDIHTHLNHVEIITDQNFALKARHVVFATGYEIPKIIQTKKHKIQSTWAFATRPQPSKIWPQKCFLWEASNPYLYIKSTKDGRVICGGEDEEIDDEDRRDALTAKKINVLQRKLKALFPQLDVQAEYAWSGFFGSSTTGLPSIGKVPHIRHTHAAMAYGGNGITFSRIAAEIIRGDITGQPDPDADLFAFRK